MVKVFVLVPSAFDVAGGLAVIGVDDLRVKLRRDARISVPKLVLRNPDGCAERCEQRAAVAPGLNPSMNAHPLNYTRPKIAASELQSL
jgi:hypothetical protein